MAELVGGSGTSQLETEGRAGSSLSAAVYLDQLKPNREIISYDWTDVPVARTYSQKAQVTFPKYTRWLRSSSFTIFQSSWSHRAPKSLGPLHFAGTDKLQWVHLELLTQGLSPRQLQLKEYLPSPHFPVWHVQEDTDFVLQALLRSSDLQPKQHCFDFHSGLEREREAGQHKATAKSSKAALSLQKGFNGQISLTNPCHLSARHGVRSLLPSCQLPYLEVDPWVGSGNRSRVRKKDYQKQTGKKLLGLFRQIWVPCSRAGTAPLQQAAEAAWEASLTAEHFASWNHGLRLLDVARLLLRKAAVPGISYSYMVYV